MTIKIDTISSVCPRHEIGLITPIFLMWNHEEEAWAWEPCLPLTQLVLLCTTMG